MDQNSGINSHSEVFESSLRDWIKDEKVGFEFIEVVGKLFYDKNIELILFRSQLIDRSASVILYKHSYSVNTVGKVLKISDSLLLARSIYKLDIPPARIDIGRLNHEWSLEKQNYSDPDDFVLEKLKDIAGKKASFVKPRDVVLFGFGRIGRLLVREFIIQGNGEQLRVRAVVTRSNDPEDIKKRAALFRHDSIHGPFRGVAVEDPENHSMHINGHEVLFLAAKNPEDIDYEQYGIHDAVMIDNTGVWRDRDGLSRHLKAKGISKVIVTAPGKGDIPNIVFGVNHESIDLSKEDVISAASCTTNAIVPPLKVIEDKLGIVKGHVETIHAYTNDQNLLDNFHKKPRRGRSAPLNMVITSTGAGSAAAKVIPSLKGKLTANAVRVPVANVSLAILSLTLKQEVTKESVNAILREAALKSDLVEQIRYSSSNDSVSSDYIGDSCACIVDSPSTQVSEDGKNVIIYLWYDNEFGYSIQVIRLVNFIADVRRFQYY